MSKQFSMTWVWQALGVAVMQWILLIPGAAQAATPMIATGGSHTCALTSDGGVKCWGRNDYGQLGDGSITQRPTPVDVSGLASGVSAIMAGLYYTCALTSNGGVQ